LYYYHSSNEHQTEEYCYIEEAQVLLGDCNGGKHQSKHSMEHLFSLDDLCQDNFAGLRNWYNNYHLLKPIIDLYELVFYNVGLTPEIRFLTLMQALETYHARFIDRGDMSLRKRLFSLFNDNFLVMGYSLEGFIGKLVNTRNYYTHYSPAKERLAFRDEELLFANGILHWVVAYHLLCNIGFEEHFIKDKVYRHIRSIGRQFQHYGIVQSEV